jgi:hypothetical protein
VKREITGGIVLQMFSHALKFRFLQSKQFTQNVFRMSSIHFPSARLSQ